MRFRANIEHVQTFQRIIQSIEKLQKRFTIKFTETEMHIICSEESDDGVQVWSTIKIDTLFTEYRIQSNANNVISIAISPEPLLQALRSAISSDDIIMKLAKKHGKAVLCFDFLLAFGGGGLNAFGGGASKARMEHNVLIEVMKPTEMLRLKEPMCPEPDIHLLLPHLQKLRTMAEHMRAMDDTLLIEAKHGEPDQGGSLRFCIESDEVRVETQWTSIKLPPMAASSTQDTEEHVKPDPDTWFRVQISIRAFLKFLSSHMLSSTTIACICENHCIILYVYIGDPSAPGGVLTFYLPARTTDDD